MKTITILIAMLFSTVAFANDYAPERVDRINLYPVTSDNENAPKYSGYYKDSNGEVHQVAVWAVSDKYLEGSVTPIESN